MSSWPKRRRRYPSTWLVLAVAVVGVAYVGDRWGQTGAWVAAGVVAAALTGIAYGAWLAEPELKDMPEDAPSVEGAPNAEPPSETRDAVELEDDGSKIDSSEHEASPATLTNAILRDADLSLADLRGADLTNVDLRGANLAGADLSGAVLRNARLGVPLPTQLPSETEGESG